MTSKYRFHNVEVEFPFKAYECQERYMSDVIKALKNEENALLESPTGTGKTLSLLCASLAWRQDYMKAKSAGIIEQFGEGKQPPKIIYASRTHTQLTQVVKELKHTIYKPKMVLLASRNQLCTLEELKEYSGSEKNRRCLQKTKNRRCHLQNNLDEFLKNGGNNELSKLVKDIEDLTLMGDQHKICPYYYSKNTAPDAEMICMPYNYLLDPKIRQSLGINLDNAVILIDEAHNIENVCADAVSLEITGIMLYHCIEEVHKAFDMLKKGEMEMEPLAGEMGMQKKMTREELEALKGVLLNLEDSLERAIVDLEGSETRSGDYMFDFLARAQITERTQEQVIDVIDRLVGMRIDQNMQEEGRDRMALEKLSTLIKRLFKDQKQTTFYRCHAETVKGSGLASGGNQILHYWCMVPGIAMEPLYKTCRSVILTSGTLSPFNSFQLELRTSFPIILENKHVVQPSQFGVLVLTKGPTKQVLDSRFKNRENPKYVNDLGCTLCNIASKSPHGMLVFLTSYTLLDKFKDTWSNPYCNSKNSILDRLAQYKKVFFEPRKNNALMKTVTEAYRQEIDEGRGAIFFAVMRGKASEGLDFANRYGRCVVLIGIPFPNYMDPRVNAKKKFLQHKRKQHNNSGYLSGQDWYNLQASRAINQSLGRVIRHKDDFGLMVLLGTRFTQSSMTSVISKWLQPRIAIHHSFGKFQRDVIQFFKNAQKQGWDSDCVRRVVIDVKAAKKRERQARIKRLMVSMESDNGMIIEPEAPIESQVDDDFPDPFAPREFKRDGENKEGSARLLNAIAQNRRRLEVDYANSESYKNLVRNYREKDAKKKKMDLAKKNAEKQKKMAQKEQEEKQKEKREQRKKIASRLIDRIKKNRSQEEMDEWDKACRSIKLMKDVELRNTKFFRVEVGNRLEFVFKQDLSMWKDFEHFISEKLRPLYHEFLTNRFDKSLWFDHAQRQRKEDVKRKMENPEKGAPPPKRQKTLQDDTLAFKEVLLSGSATIRNNIIGCIEDYNREKKHIHTSRDIRAVDLIFSSMKRGFTKISKEQEDFQQAFEICVKGVMDTIADCHLTRFLRFMDVHVDVADTHLFLPEKMRRQASYTTGNMAGSVDPVTGKRRAKKKKRQSLPNQPSIRPPPDLNLKKSNADEHLPLPKLEKDVVRNTIDNPIVIDDDDEGEKLISAGKRSGMSKKRSQELADLAALPPEPFRKAPSPEPPLRFSTTDSDSDSDSDVQLLAVKKKVEDSKPKKVIKKTFQKAKGTGTSKNARRLLKAIDSTNHGFSLEIKKKTKPKFPPPPRLPTKEKNRSLSDPKPRFGSSRTEPPRSKPKPQITKEKQSNTKKRPQFGSKAKRPSTHPGFSKFDSISTKTAPRKCKLSKPKKKSRVELLLQQKGKKSGKFGGYKRLNSKTDTQKLYAKHLKGSKFDETFKGGKRSGRTSKSGTLGIAPKKKFGRSASVKSKISFLQQGRIEKEHLEREKRIEEELKEQDRLDRRAWDPSMASKKYKCSSCQKAAMLMKCSNANNCELQMCYSCWLAATQKRKQCAGCGKWVNVNKLQKVE